jgi:hypothetical protein
LTDRLDFVVNVSNVAPTLTLSGNDTVETGTAYVLNLASSDPGLDTISQWQINWGDGVVDTIDGNPASVNHVYAVGSYTITAEASDEDGQYAANELNVTVNAANRNGGGEGQSHHQRDVPPFRGNAGQALFGSRWVEDSLASRRNADTLIDWESWFNADNNQDNHSNNNQDEDDSRERAKEKSWISMFVSNLAQEQIDPNSEISLDLPDDDAAVDGDIEGGLEQ